MQYLTVLALLVTTGLAVPLTERQACSGPHEQCGGIGWDGPTCCVEGCECELNNEYYSQCIPTSGYVPVTTTFTTAAVTVSTPAPQATGGATWSGNPFEGVRMWANDYYRDEVYDLAIPQLPASLVPAAEKVAEVPSFMWMDTRSKVPLMAETCQKIREANQGITGTPYAGIFVVYDLPDRDCAAAASNGELLLAENGEELYKGYIDSIVTVVKEYSDLRLILMIEPDSLANLVTNMDEPKCAGAADAYQSLTQYAIKALNLPNVAMYLDAGHAGWLGWDANIGPAAELFANVWRGAGNPSQVRGLATNVANYNAWTLNTAPPYTQGNSIYDEKKYINAIAPRLAESGFPTNFITDTSRNGVQPTSQIEWGHWCNVIDTGFGVRPTTNTGDALADAFVWIKPGGECDGTSDTSAERYDWHCGLEDALQPAPEAGTWFQAYFEQLLRNANPAF